MACSNPREAGRYSTKAASALASGSRWQCGITVLVLALTWLAASSPAAAGLAASAPPDLPAAPDSAAAVAPGPHWLQATPAGGTIVALAQSPSSPQTLYAVADTGDLFASENGGASWSARRGAPPDTPITSLVVDPKDPATVYAVTYASSGSSLLRTRNGARSWKGIGFDVFVYSLLVDAENPSVLYAPSLGGLYRSLDRGESWTVLAFAGSPGLSLAIDPFDGRRLLAAVGGNATSDPTVVWRSLDRGKTWQPASMVGTPGDLDFYFPHLVFDPARRGTAYAFFVITGSPGAVFRTRDGGVSSQSRTSMAFSPWILRTPPRSTPEPCSPGSFGGCPPDGPVASEVSSRRRTSLKTPAPTRRSDPARGRDRGTAGW